MVLTVMALDGGGTVSDPDQADCKLITWRKNIFKSADIRLPVPLSQTFS